MILRRVIFWVGAVSLLLAPYIFSEQGASGADRAADSRITISHSGCRGSCPVYDLTLFPSGLVLYNGVRYVKTIGKAQTQIQPNTYRAFLLDFDRVNFFSLGECALTMDAPGTTTTVAAYGRSKTVHHTGGCILEPRTEATANSKQWIELTDLEARIEATVNSKQWTE